MILKRVFIIILAIITFASCDFHWGGCPKVKYEIDKFELPKYNGSWFEVIRSKSIPFEKGNCIEDIYSITGNRSFNVTAKEVYNGVEIITQGKAEPTDNQFQFQLAFEMGILTGLIKGDYQIINTDYKNFSVIYSCTDLRIARLEYIWVMSRTQSVSQNDLNNYSRFLLNKFGIQENTLFFNNQTDCYK